ncbi:hypothetical protein KW797_03290, partial [Candidatus Parcubacteria bacterium]|nr:hypothetical protein [Candidatus Parcubacteria bacterium]
HNEVAALAKERSLDEKRKTYKYIVDHAEVPAIASLKSEAQKLQVASDALDLPGTAGVSYLDNLVEGWFGQFKSAYIRLEKQLDVLLTHLSILKSQFTAHPPSANNS